MGQVKLPEVAAMTKAHKSLEKIIRTRYRQIYSFLCWLCHDPECAADLTQETFVAAWRDVGALRNVDHLDTWLYRVARNTFLQARRKRQPLTDALSEEQSASFATAGPESNILAKLTLHNALARLPETEREAIILHKLQDLSCAETALALDRPIGTIKRQISTGLQRMKAVLQNEKELFDEN